jgi:hypothetical protein
MNAKQLIENEVDFNVQVVKSFKYGKHTVEIVQSKTTGKYGYDALGVFGNPVHDTPEKAAKAATSMIDRFGAKHGPVG